jgi:two-component system repressor protein LuxO
LLARIYSEYLKKAGMPATIVETGAAAMDVLRQTPPQVLLLDLALPDINGMDVLKWVSDQQIPVAVVVITAHASINRVVEAMRLGAYDFLVKPFAADRLVVTARNALERTQLARIVDTYQDDLARSRYCGFIGSSLAMQAVYRIVDSAATSKATVFITGESGTGRRSAPRPFIAAVRARAGRSSPSIAAPFPKT